MSSSRYFTPEFVQQIMQARSPAKNISVNAVKMLEVDNSASILAALASARTEELIGHFGMEVTYSVDGENKVDRMVMKIKPHGQQIVDMLNMLAQACGGELATIYPRHKTWTGFHHTHLREQEIYSKLQPSFTPTIYGLHTKEDENEYVVLMEYLEDVSLLNTVMEPQLWTDLHIKTTLTQMARWHSSMLGKTHELDGRIWDDTPTTDYMMRLMPVWQALLNNAAEKFGELYSPARVRLLQKTIDSIPGYWPYLEKVPKTLVHNDTNPRNSCFKIIGGELQLCLYDWELATFHIPQYDVAEFLSFVLDEDRYALRSSYIEFYRQELNGLTGKYTDEQVFLQEFYLAALDFGIHRLGMYMMAHAVSPYPFLPRVVNSYFDMITSLETYAQPLLNTQVEL
jgi:hypothetical protein